nr:f-box/kelch-repeat protein [Quercus suber]
MDVALRVERYKLIHEDNDNNVFSSEQIQDLKLQLSSRLCSYFQLVGSANGLFCLYDENRFILWNPCIRKFITLPNPSVEFPCYLAFGFDSRTNDYKVVRIAYRSNTRYEGAKPPLVEVYSVSEGSWRVTSAGDSYPPKITIRNWHPEAASLNGAVYFVANDWGNTSSKVLSFNLGDEVFRMISLPNGKSGLYAHIFTSVFKGLLSLICYEQWHMDEHYSCSIWVMKEYGVVDSWTKQFTIDLNMGYWKVLGFWKNDHVLVQKIQPHGLMVFSYDPESQQVKNLGFCKSAGFPYADNYVENLVLLDKPNDVVSKEESEQEEEVQDVAASSVGMFMAAVFGFDLRTDDYKVVRIAYQSVNIRYEGAKPPLVEVYSVNEGSWRVTSGGDSCPPRITISNWHPQATSLNGAVYFVVNDWGDAQSLIVLSFDLGDEVFRLISLPNGKFGLDADIGTSEFKGLLSLICYESRHMGQRYSCSVWVMKEYGDVDSWTKQFTIELNMLRWTVLGFWKNDHVLVQKMQSDSLMRIQSHG